ncbi:peptidase M4 [Pyxidicoccus fallax]|uniref:Peptidase M4 n=1 Tax=Pyxidicoccus fallax TaxID=394095 RepID=A0A848LA09_9BACT|nr:M4 family metallopeptidase [Pyxidicoccus fallax]NMO15092.1 peptidase M4 [Pyxidicoccus fallax]NPC79794.1 peptidase M4 [Pyxidicoccus fallax]
MAWLGAGIVACSSPTEEAPRDTGSAKDADVKSALARFKRAEVLGVQDDVPYFVRGDLGRVPPVSELRAREAGEDVRGLLNDLAPVFRLRGNDLVFRKQSLDEQGHRHLRFRQHHQGLPVIGGELVVHVDSQGLVYAANGSARGGPTASTDVKVAPEVAAKVAVSGSRAEPAFVDGPAERVFLRPEGEKELHLAWQVRVKGQRDGMPSDDLVYVDAKDGVLLAVHPRIHSARNRRVYSANNGTSLPGTLRRSEAGAPTGDSHVDQNFDRLGDAYNCYKTVFNRDSYDNAGATLISTVHYRSRYVNAYWDGTQLVYGDGDGVNSSELGKDLDVTVHELTHAVTERESDLIFSGESGGLNESISDIFAGICESWTRGWATDADVFKIGEDIWTPGIPGDALRYMSDPTQDGDSLDYYPDYTSGTDVHYSSGISNLVFTLLAKGGTHPRGKTAIHVTAIGVEKAARIFYKANTDLFTPSTSFPQARTATQQAAVQLGYDSNTVDSVTNAWAAVGVGAPASFMEPTPAHETPPNPVPDATLVQIPLSQVLTDPPRHDEESQVEDRFLPDLPILVNGVQYTAEQLRAQDIHLAHYVLDERSAELNVVQGFRTSAELQTYMRSTNQYPSEQPTSLQQALCNQHSVFFEHANYAGASFTVPPGLGLSYVGNTWNDRISSVWGSRCASWTVLGEHINLGGYWLWIGRGWSLNNLRGWGYYTGFWIFRSWHSWNDRVSSVILFW